MLKHDQNNIKTLHDQNNIKTLLKRFVAVFFVPQPRIPPFWKALTSTTEIQIIVAIIFLVFLISIVTYFSSDADKAQRYARFTPSLLVSIGIFGTFLGIFFALVDFNVNRVDESIPELLSGLKVAFGTSIVGLFLSLSINFILYS